MGLVERLDTAIARHRSDNSADELRRVAQEAAASGPAEREAFVAALASRLDGPDPVLSARLALVAGAIVETGIPPGPLGLAIMAPLQRTLIAARHFVELVEALPGKRDGEDEDHEDEEGEGGNVYVGARRLSPTMLDAVAQRDPEAFRAWSSLEIWYRPAVAAWTRDHATLCRVQESASLRSAAQAIATSSDAYFIALLLEVCLDEPFVVLIPELKEAWHLVLDGCVDNQQFLVLLSEALGGSLRRLGVAAPAPKNVLAIARGEGPQQAAGTYGASFATYAWQAIDPETSRPVDGRFKWVAPGGAGSIWLPGDFPPSRVEPLEGARVVALVKSSMTRMIPASRTFGQLKASISHVRQLSPEEARPWVDKVAPKLFDGGEPLRRPWWQLWKT